MDQTQAYIVAMVLNPCVRFSWIQKHWEDDYILDAQTKIKALMVKYRTRHADSAPVPPSLAPSRAPSPAAWTTIASQYGLDDDFDIPDALPSTQTVEEEYAAYMTASLSIKGTSLLDFWQMFKLTFPTFYLIALDFLPIQASSVPSERVFSSSAEMDTARRNRIKPELMEALQMLKHSIKKDRMSFTEGWQTDAAMMEDASCAAANDDDDILASLFAGDASKGSSLFDTLFALLADDDDELQAEEETEIINID
jgi:hypothetical protein